MPSKHSDTDAIIKKDRISHTAYTIRIMRDQILNSSMHTKEVSPMAEDILKCMNNAAKNNKTETNVKEFVIYTIFGLIFISTLLIIITHI
jgi:hypothetical protein